MEENTLNNYTINTLDDLKKLSNNVRAHCLFYALNPNKNWKELETTVDVFKMAESIAKTAEIVTDAKLDQNSTNPIQNQAIAKLIPFTASSTNQLADKNFVNSTVGTNTANYIYKTVEDENVPFDSVEELEAYTGTVTQNDYAFVTGIDEDGNRYFDRYKATVNNGVVEWAKEYRLNNSSFTAEQWAAIQSGITAEKIEQLDTAINNKVSAVTYDATNKKITRTINGTTADVVTVATLKSAMSLAKGDVGLGNVTNVATESTITSGSTNNITSGAVYTGLAGKAPNNHASTATTYGLGTTSNYGHVKTVNNVTTASHSDGLALSAYQGKVLKDAIDGKVPTTRKINENELSDDVTLYGSDIAMSSSDTTTLKSAIDGKAPTVHSSAATTYGAASATDYGHAKASSTTPKANGTAAVGIETDTFARGDHVHPLQTYVGQAENAYNAKKLHNEYITIQTGASQQAKISLSTLMSWLLTKGYIHNTTQMEITKIIQTSWYYAGNDILQLNAHGIDYELQLAGVIIEFMGSASSDTTGVFRLRIHSAPTTSFTPTSGYTIFPVSHIAEYTCNGNNYYPTWKIIKDFGDRDKNEVYVGATQPSSSEYNLWVKI